MQISIEAFVNSLICNEKIKEICKLDFVNYKGSCYRAIKHSNIIALSINDFLPSIMERNNNEMPDTETQLKHKKYKDYSVSLNESLEKLKEIVQFVPTLRDSVCSYAIGYFSKTKGVITKPESNGHIHYFLFDPKGKNPVSDFRFIVE